MVGIPRRQGNDTNAPYSADAQRPGPGDPEVDAAAPDERPPVCDPDLD